MVFIRSATLVAATLATGLTAGVFALYSHTVMPGLRSTGDRTFVAAFQALDTAIINPWFMVAFLGAPAFAAAAALVRLGRPGLSWIVVALALYLVAFVITIAVNVPLNDALKAAGDPDRIADLAAVRERFDEARWVWWNHLRTVSSTAAFGCLAVALLRS